MNLDFPALMYGSWLQVGKGKIVKVSGIKDQGRTASVLLRGSNKLVLEEAERSLHDALCVVRCLVHKRYLIPGGAAPEVELNIQLSRWAKSLVVCFQWLTASYPQALDKVAVLSGRRLLCPYGAGLCVCSPKSCLTVLG